MHYDTFNEKHQTIYYNLIYTVQLENLFHNKKYTPRSFRAAPHNSTARNSALHPYSRVERPSSKKSNHIIPKEEKKKTCRSLARIVRTTSRPYRANGSRPSRVHCVGCSTVAVCPLDRRSDGGRGEGMTISRRPRRIPKTTPAKPVLRLTCSPTVVASYRRKPPTTIIIIRRPMSSTSRQCSRTARSSPTTIIIICSSRPTTSRPTITIIADPARIISRSVNGIAVSIHMYSVYIYRERVCVCVCYVYIRFLYGSWRVCNAEIAGPGNVYGVGGACV